MVHTFENDGAGNWLPISDDNDVTDTLVSTAFGYIHTTSNDTHEYYDLNGRLTRIEFRGGEALNLLCDPQSRLESVADESDRVLDFTYAGIENRITAAATPDGVYRYAYDANFNLSTVIKPDTNAITYHYEDPNFINALTGITDETWRALCDLWL